MVACLRDAISAWREKHPSVSYTEVKKASSLALDGSMKVVLMLYNAPQGANNMTEMYSAMRAEVPLPSDTTTQFNDHLMTQLQRASQVTMCTNALLHMPHYNILLQLYSYWSVARHSRTASTTPRETSSLSGTNKGVLT